MLARARDAGNLCYLISELLSSPLFPDYLKNVALHVSGAYVQDMLVPLVRPDGTSHSVFPVLFNQHDAAFVSFRQKFAESQAENIRLRILAFAFHNLQAFIQEEHEKKKGDGVFAVQESDSDLLANDLNYCCELLAKNVQLDLPGIYLCLVAIFQEIRYCVCNL